MKETNVIVTDLIWDDWNVNHIARHNVMPETGILPGAKGGQE